MTPSFPGTGVGGGFDPADLQLGLRAAVGLGGLRADRGDRRRLRRSQCGIGPRHIPLAVRLAACTTANGCFKKVNQTGGNSYPAAEAGWSVEISLDLDMVSAACPNCHLLLVEAENNEDVNLYAAEDEAVTLGATEVSDSWAGEEYPGET